MLFDVSEVFLNYLSTFSQPLSFFGLLEPVSHRLHCRSVRPNLYIPPSFLVLADTGNRTVFHMTTVLLDELSLLLGFTPKVQLPVLRAGYALDDGVIPKIPGTVTLGLVCSTIPRSNQNSQLLLRRQSHLAASAIAAVGHC